MVTHDQTSRHTHHICYKRGCTAHERIGCSCACDCSDDGVEFYGEEFGTMASRFKSSRPKVIASHKKLAKLGIAAMRKNSFHDGKTFPNAHRITFKEGGEAGDFREASEHYLSTGVPTSSPTEYGRR